MRDFKQYISDYEERLENISRRHKIDPIEVDPEKFKPYKIQPPYFTQKLFGYQLEGLNWLRFSWYKKINVILAGKSQTTFFFSSKFVN